MKKVPFIVTYRKNEGMSCGSPVGEKAHGKVNMPIES